MARRTDEEDKEVIMDNSSKGDLFLKLANPNEEGVSRWVSINEFVDEYAELKFGNGGSWIRPSTKIAQTYIIRTKKADTRGKPIIEIKLDGFNSSPKSTQTIRKDIHDAISAQRCVVLGTSDPEVDHKNGWKNGEEVYDLAAQKMNDFQPLSKAANDAKRQFCKECRSSHNRYDAKRLGYPISFYAGGNQHDGSDTGCIGCFWYDPIEFRKHLTQK